MNKIEIVIVDESLLTSKLIFDKFKNDTRYAFTGRLYNLQTAIKQVIKLKPNVVIVDLKMISMDGCDFIIKLFAKYKVPIVAVSTNKNDKMNAISAGAKDFVVKPESAFEDTENFTKELMMSVNLASIIKYESEINISNTVKNDNIKTTKGSIIAIGASTGGTEAILKVIKGLKKADLPPIIIVQHMPAGFTNTYAKRLDDECDLFVNEAVDNELLANDHVILAAGGYHLTVERRHGNKLVIRSKKGDKVSSHCPSVDVMFESIASVCKNKENIMAIILTGMGKDGAQGLLKLKEVGAYTVGQDEKSSIVYGMPMEAYKLGAVTKQLPLDKISEEIIKWVGSLK